ncbi:MAG: uL30 family ribosomal protein [Rickettsiales bacterium]|jgi:large subunit ribosomal protein L30|nr:uL30 family ribosomal protein [Rickettsiales bacterium]
MLQKFEEIENKIIIVEQIGSEIGSSKRQKESLKGLGLRGVGTTFELKCSKPVYGLLKKMEHLIKVNVKG